MNPASRPAVTLRIGMKVATGSAVRKSRMMRLQRPDFSMMSA
jgi:hypothetical protein